MPHCVVPNCSNRTEKGVRLFIFPQGERNEERRNLWIRNVNREDLPSKPFICEVHFENDQFENNRMDEKRFLKPDAVPTIFSDNSNIIDETSQSDPLHSNDESELQGEIRRSTRKRKPIKFEEYDSDEEYSKSDEEMMDAEEAKENMDDTRVVELIRCKTCLTVQAKESSHIMKKLIYGKTIKQIIVICTPELESSLLDTEYICQKCYRFLTKLMYFIESCRDSEEKIKSGAVSMEDFSKVESYKIVPKKSIQDPTETPVKRKRGRPRKDENRLQNSEKKIVQSVEPAEPPIKRKRGRPRKIHPEIEKPDDEFKILGSSDIQNEKEYVKKETTNTTSSLMEQLKDKLKRTGIIQIIIEDENDKSNEKIENTVTLDLDNETIEDDENVPNNLEIIASDHSYLSPPIRKLLSCSYCQSDYRTLRGIKTHLTQVHGIQVVQNTECSLCKMKFIRYKDMVKHKVSHGHICSHCDKNFTTRAELEVHQSTHPEIFCCTRCGMKFKTEEILKKHTPLHLMMSQICMQIKNNANDCPHCDMQFISENILHQHIKAVHEKLQSYQCNDCDEKYSSQQQLKVHMRIKHETGISAYYACSECGEVYKRKELFDHHLKSHAVVSINPFKNPVRKTYSRVPTENTFKCQFCETKANSKETFIEHLAVHEDLKRFECKYCDLKLSSLKTKYSHERTHDDSLPTCAVCATIFENEEMLEQHEEEEHDKKEFICNICNAMFNQHIKLQCHVLDEHVKEDKKVPNEINVEINNDVESDKDPNIDMEGEIVKFELNKEDDSISEDKSENVNITKQEIENDWDSEPESPSFEGEIQSVKIIELIEPEEKDRS